MILKQRGTLIQKAFFCTATTLQEEDNNNKQRKAFIGGIILTVAQRLSKPMKYKYNNSGTSTGNFRAEFPSIMMQLSKD